MIDLSLLSQPMTISDERVQFYNTHNFIKIKSVLSDEIVDYFNQHISAKVKEINTNTVPLNNRDTYGKAFLQLFNLWEIDPVIKELVFSKRLASIASQLMQVDEVRLYHDQALFKEASGGITPWHADQYYWPLASDKTVTAWIPLQKITLDMGPLEFSAGSQAVHQGRELSIGDESEQKIGQRLRVTDFKHVITPFDVGEISFHSGWVFHRAGANQTHTTRKVMTVIYMEKDMRLKAPENDGQRNDWEKWCPGAKIDEIIDSPLNPILFAQTTE